nr:unnamed protein product [Callosobruchus chinensis]
MCFRRPIMRRVREQKEQHYMKELKKHTGQAVTDESRFRLVSDDYRERVWRERGGQERLATAIGVAPYRGGTQMNVLSSDELRFGLVRDDYRERVWMKREQNKLATAIVTFSYSVILDKRHQNEIATTKKYTDSEMMKFLIIGCVNEESFSKSCCKDKAHSDENLMFDEFLSTKIKFLPVILQPFIVIHGITTSQYYYLLSTIKTSTHRKNENQVMTAFSK